MKRSTFLKLTTTFITGVIALFNFPLKLKQSNNIIWYADECYYGFELHDVNPYNIPTITNRIWLTDYMGPIEDLEDEEWEECGLTIVDLDKECDSERAYDWHINHSPSSTEAIYEHLNDMNLSNELLDNMEFIYDSSPLQEYRGVYLGSVDALSLLQIELLKNGMEIEIKVL